MANNRMHLALPSGKKLLLAKYYPSTGWYMTESREQSLVADLRTFLNCEEIKDSIANANDGTFPIKVEFD